MIVQIDRKCREVINEYLQVKNVRELYNKNKFSKHLINRCLNLKDIIYMILTNYDKLDSDSIYKKKLPFLIKKVKGLSINEKILIEKILPHIDKVGIDKYIEIIGYLSATRKFGRVIKPLDEFYNELIILADRIYEKSDRVRIGVTKPEIKNALQLVFFLIGHKDNSKYLDLFVNGIQNRKKFKDYKLLINRLENMDTLPYKDKVTRKLKEKLNIK